MSIRLLSRKLLLIILVSGSCSSSIGLTGRVSPVDKNLCKILHLQFMRRNRKHSRPNTPTKCSLRQPQLGCGDVGSSPEKTLIPPKRHARVKLFVRWEN